jgi:hypothetical protein
LLSVIYDAAAADDDSNSNNNHNNKLFMYLRAELNSQWPIAESARIHAITAVRQIK